MTKFYSHGKLLLSSEYAVLDGAKALAIPTRFGQDLEVHCTGDTKALVWKSFTQNQELWFNTHFGFNSSDQLIITDSSDTAMAETLVNILTQARALSTTNINLQGLEVHTHLEFNRSWGLGSSSTLINNIASWFQIDAYALLERSFGGSGYDIACAQHTFPIVYQIQNNQPTVSQVKLNWPFGNQIYFVYLNKKQNSRTGISNYKKKKALKSQDLTHLNEITEAMIATERLSDFNKLIKAHNEIISRLIGEAPVGDLLFKDFDGEMKNLGAWGGDFILVTSKTDPRNYFKSKGYPTVLPFTEMIL